MSVALIALSACDAEERDAGAVDSGTSHEPGEVGLHSPGLWAEVQIDGEWAERFATLRDLAMTTDIAAVVRIESAEAGRVIQGDAKEDVYCEVNLNVTTVDVLHSTSDDTSFQVSLVLPRAFSTTAQNKSVQAVNASLPMKDVVMFVRRRKDLPLYRVANGWGIWAKTTRDSLDAPLNVERVGDGGLYASELEGVNSVPEFIARIRDLLDEG